jgi:hypothetical protein
MAKKYGRTYKTKKYDNIQMEVGVINNEFPKSIYCDIKCYIKSVDTNYRQNIRKFLKSIENTIELNIDTVLFNKRFIFISDIPDTMVTKGDGFVSFSINLFDSKIINIMLNTGLSTYQQKNVDKPVKIIL